MLGDGRAVDPRFTSRSGGDGPTTTRRQPNRPGEHRVSFPVLRYPRRVAELHPWLGAAAISVCASAAFIGGILYWRGRGAGAITTHLLSLAQTLLVAQVGVGLLLLADDRRAGDELHYAYGSLALAVALTPWFYAPESGPRRLLWFAATTGVAGALAIRAYMTGSA